MTDTQIAKRQGAAIRSFGDLPPAQTGLTAQRALELAGVDATELALLASTTFKHAKTLEELVSLVATTRRRGLDGLSKHVYFEQFGGANNDPSLHTAIDGLRAIAAATGRYAGSSEPRFSGTCEMERKTVPEKCSVTVYAIVQGRSCAFDGTAWMEESYKPNTFWKGRPRSMLAIAAERQALRKAFPSETAGIADADVDEADAEPAPRQMVVESARKVVENGAAYDRIYTEDTPAPTKRQRPLEELVQHYRARLHDAFGTGLIPEDDLEQWTLPEDATREVVLEAGLRLADLQKLAADKPRLVKTGDKLADELAELIEAAAANEVEFGDCVVSLPAPVAVVQAAIQNLQLRLDEAMADDARDD